MPHVDYYENGVKFPSVTEILGAKPKPWLVRWKDKWGILADRKTEAATNVGTAFHEAAEKLAKGEIVYVPANRRLATMLHGFEKWLISSGLVVKETELHVVSHLHTFAGTFDAVGYLADNPKTLVIFDWKTSASIYPEMAEQLAAYAIAYEEMTGVNIKRGLIVLVSKDKPFHRVTVKGYSLGRRLRNKFLKRLREFHAQVAA